jgi:hypothetical protein
MPGFEVYERTRAARAPGAAVTFASHGAISFNMAAYELLGQPEAVVLLWDKGERLAGFRPASTGEHAAYRIRLNGSRTRQISGSAFRSYIGLEGGSRRWPIFMEGGVGVVDLKQPGTLIGAKAH